MENKEKTVEGWEEDFHKWLDGRTFIHVDYSKQTLEVNLPLLGEYIRSTREEAKREEREGIARMVSQAGENMVTLLINEDSFTGTYWISANMLYFLLTGRHLNQDYEDGIVEKNPSIEALLRNVTATDKAAIEEFRSKSHTNK